MEKRKTPKVESHAHGTLVYFNNVLVRSNNLNEHTDFNYWKKTAEDNPDFCPAQFHKNITCINCNCKKK